MAYSNFLKKHKDKGTRLKVFLSSNKTMLSGKITDFDDDSIILDECLILREQIISISPE